MCRSRDVKTGCVFSMRFSQFMVWAFLCVHQHGAFSAPTNAVLSTGDGNTQTATILTNTSEKPHQPNAQDSTSSIALTQVHTLTPQNKPSISSILTTSINDVTNPDSKDSTSASVTTKGAVSSITSDNKYDYILSTTKTTHNVFLSDSTSTTKAATTVLATQSAVKTTAHVIRNPTGTTAEQQNASTTSVVPTTTTGSTSTFQQELTTVATTLNATVDARVVKTTSDPWRTNISNKNTSATTKSGSQIDGSATDVTVPPVIPGTNITLNPVTMDGVSGSSGAAPGPITDAITVGVIDPKTFTPPPKSISTASTSSVGAVVANGSATTITIDPITGVESSSGDEISAFMGVSADKNKDFTTTTQLQTAASNTTVFVTSNEMNLTTLTNTTIYITTTTTAKDEMISTTMLSSTPPASVPTTDGMNTTIVPIINTQPSVPPGGNDSPGKTGEKKTSAEQGSLTIILLVLCASLLAILLALCVFTYVKFRKKSRSIRKRLTFKDDSIYDNPIYHGRWEVPKAPEPTSSSCPRSLPMLISALPDEVVRLSKDGDTGFHMQFMMLHKLSPNSPRTVATTEMNTHKNRYRDILPFDHNRVKLGEDGEKSDYINASFVPGVKSEKEYVASQGPLERTAADHWRMIWELNIRVIAMLTTCEEGDYLFKSKCCQYWPNKENESVNYEGIYVTLVSTTRLCRENYKLKVLHIRKGKDSEPRKVQLFQYIKWPDRKYPDDPEAFLEYRDQVKQEMSAFEEQSPLLVHCSAGVGRTGTFIAIDTLLQHMEERESLDVYGLVLRLRKYRVLLVQNSSQYKFIHTCLLIILDKMKKAEVDEDQKKAGLDGSYPYENMVMGQRAVVGELGGLVHGGDNAPAQSSAVQSFLRKTKTNVQPDVEPEDQQCQYSDGMPSPVKVEEWPRPLSDPVPRPVIETPKSKPFSGGTKGDPERALAKELGGMFQGGVERHASPGKTAAIKAFLRNRELESETVPTNSDHNPNGDSLVIDNRFREQGDKQTTCL